MPSINTLNYDKNCCILIICLDFVKVCVLPDAEGKIIKEEIVTGNNDDGHAPYLQRSFDEHMNVFRLGPRPSDIERYYFQCN